MEELKWISAELHNSYDTLNPNYLTDCDFPYSDHLKNCYYLDNDG